LELRQPTLYLLAQLHQLLEICHRIRESCHRDKLMRLSAIGYRLSVGRLLHDLQI
jgi:hypothetical protein